MHACRDTYASTHTSTSTFASTSTFTRTITHTPMPMPMPRSLYFRTLVTWPYMGVSKNQGHLIWTQNRIPKTGPQYGTPSIHRNSHICIPFKEAVPRQPRAIPTIKGVKWGPQRREPQEYGSKIMRTYLIPLFLLHSYNFLGVPYFGVPS